MKGFLLGALIVLVNPCFITADTMHLNNGDRLRGEIKSLSSAHFTFMRIIASPQPETLQIDSNPPVSLEEVVVMGKEGAIPEEPGFLESWDGSVELEYTF